MIIQSTDAAAKVDRLILNTWTAVQGSSCDVNKA